MRVSLSQVIALILFKKLYTDSKILVRKFASYICLQGVIYGTFGAFRQLNDKINTNSCNDRKGKVPALSMHCAEGDFLSRDSWSLFAFFLTFQVSMLTKGMPWFWINTDETRSSWKIDGFKPFAPLRFTFVQ